MTFAEADARFEGLRRRYQTGGLTAEQYDAELRQLMIMDAASRWWSKARTTGEWHYYDPIADRWIPATPPVEGPPVEAPPATAVGLVESAAALPTAAGLSTDNPSTDDLSTDDLSTADLSTTDLSTTGQITGNQSTADLTAGVPAASDLAAGTAVSPYPTAPSPAPVDAAAEWAGWAPVTRQVQEPALSGAVKAVFAVFSLLIPVVGIVLFFVYRGQPHPADRSAARLFLILGVVSFALSCLCSTIFVVAIQAAALNWGG